MIDKQKLIGEWRLTHAEMTVSDTTENTFNPERIMVKLFSETHFSFYSKTRDRAPYSAAVTDEERLTASKTLDAGGGTYDLEGHRYTENVIYCTYPNYEGRSLSFDLTIEGDQLIQQGHYPLKALGFGDEDGYVKEVYQRVRNGKTNG